MKKRLTTAVIAAGLALGGASPALAQLPDVPGIDAARDQVGGEPAAARPASREVSNLPGSDAIPNLQRPASAARGTGSPTRLPVTGVDTTALALDAVTLLGAGALLLAVRRRLAGSSA